MIKQTALSGAVFVWNELHFLEGKSAVHFCLTQEKELSVRRALFCIFEIALRAAHGAALRL